MKGSASEFSDWANLPLLVLHLISEKIDFITDYIRYRAVCSSWRFASLPKPRHLPPQLPWLFCLQPDKRSYVDHLEDDGICYFFDFLQSKDIHHKIHIPETIKYTCIATCRGWLLFVAHGGKELFLLNPLTRDRVQLPPFTTPVKIIGDHDEDSCTFCSMFDSSINRDDGSSILSDMFDSWTGYPNTKLSFSTDPTDPNCLIMVFVFYCTHICFCQVTDHCWTEVVVSSVVSGNMDDVAYSNGRFYLLQDRSISIYDPNQHKVLGTYFFKPEFQPGNKFFFEGKSGLYFVAFHNTKERGEEAEEGTEKTFKQKIELYQIQKQQIAGDYYSLDGGCVYLKYMEHVQFGCAAYFDNDSDGTYRCSILSAKLDDGKSELVAVGTGKKQPSWKPFWKSSPPTMWFQPSFI